MCRITFLGSRFARAGTPSATHPRTICEALPEVEQEPFIDAEAIAEAVNKQKMRCAEIKTQEQLDGGFKQM